MKWDYIDEKQGSVCKPDFLDNLTAVSSVQPPLHEEVHPEELPEEFKAPVTQDPPATFAEKVREFFRKLFK